ncbi:protein disulfide-isomerase precursor, partial [Modicella reniformis]
MDEIGSINYASYHAPGSVPLAYYFYNSPEERNRFSIEFEDLAKELKGKMNFVYIDASKFGSHAYNLYLREEWPAFGIQNVSDGTKFPLEGELSFDKIKALCEEVLAGTVEPSIKSEPIPETNDGPVKVVVAHTYKEIVEDLDKDVLIVFYAPWCDNSVKMTLNYEKLGELYEGSKIVIAKLNAPANELPQGVPFQIDCFPTIKFRRAGSTEYIDYSGDRSLENFVEFITENAVNKFEVKVEALLEFVKTNSVPIMEELGRNNYAPYQAPGNVPLAYYFYKSPEQRSRFSTEFEGLAKELKGKMNFVYTDGCEFGNLAVN